MRIRSHPSYGRAVLARSSPSAGCTGCDEFDVRLLFGLDSGLGTDGAPGERIGLEVPTWSR
jgi:hypothetical protein